MDKLGKFTTGFVIAVFVAGVVAGVLSVPDIRRYFKMRQM